jgi:hypothetical protein
MATQRTLKLNLLADVDKFGKGLMTAGNDAKGFGGKVKQAGKIAAGAFLAVAAAAGDKLRGAVVSKRVRVSESKRASKQAMLAHHTCKGTALVGKSRW